MDRESTIHDFKTDVCNLLIATSVAARGLDIKDLIVVINYDPPNHHEDYIHRVGRTGKDFITAIDIFNSKLFVALILLACYFLEPYKLPSVRAACFLYFLISFVYFTMADSHQKEKSTRASTSLALES